MGLVSHHCLIRYVYQFWFFNPILLFPSIFQFVGYEYRESTEKAVFFLFVEVSVDLHDLTVPQLQGVLHSGGIPFATRSNKETLIALCDANLPTRMKLEICGTAFAITPRRFISCHHCVFRERSSTTLQSVVICSSVVKQADAIVPDPNPESTTFAGELHSFDANLDFAIFELRGEGHLTPIPVCPEHSLPTSRHTTGVTLLYSAVGDFQVSGFPSLEVWRGGPFSIKQYGQYANSSDPPKCRMLLEHGLLEHGRCRGSSGGALVTNNGYVAAMHVASLDKGQHVRRRVRGSSLAHQSVGESITDWQQRYSAYKEGLVLCRVPAIMNAINNP